VAKADDCLLRMMNGPAGFSLIATLHGAGQFEHPVDRQRLVGLALRVPFLDVEVEAGQPVRR
jgi:hypothetical protein